MVMHGRVSCFIGNLQGPPGVQERCIGIISDGMESYSSQRKNS